MITLNVHKITTINVHKRLQNSCTKIASHYYTKFFSIKINHSSTSISCTPTCTYKSAILKWPWARVCTHGEECSVYHRRRISPSCWFRLSWGYAYSFWLCATWEMMTPLFSECGGSLRAWDVWEYDVVKLPCCKFSFAAGEKNRMHFTSKFDKFLDGERRTFVLELSQDFGICSQYNGWSGG